MSAFDLGASLQGLADQIVGLEDGTDFVKGPSRPLFIELVVNKDTEKRDVEKYVAIYDIVARHADASDWMRIAARDQIVNGRRRMKGADMRALADELALIAEDGAGLDPSRERDLLLAATHYNRGLILRGLRCYEDAADAQLSSSAYYGLAGSRNDQLVGIFVSQVEMVTATFISGDDTLVSREVQALIDCRNFVRGVCVPYPDWMEQNAHLHVGWAAMMATLLEVGDSANESFTQGSWLASEDLEHGLTNGPGHWTALFKLWQQFEDYMDCNAVIEAAPQELDSSSANNVSLTTQIIVAMAERKLDKADEARKRLEAVVAFDGSDGGLPVAVAKRLLAKSD